MACLLLGACLVRAAAPPARITPSESSPMFHLVFPKRGIDVTPVAFSGDSRLVAVWAGLGTDVYDLKDGSHLLRVRGANTMPVAFAADGEAIVVDDRDRSPLYAVSLRTKKRLDNIPHLVNGGGADYGPRLSPDARIRCLVDEFECSFDEARSGRRAGPRLTPPSDLAFYGCQFTQGGSFLTVFAPPRRGGFCSAQVWERVTRQDRHLRGAVPRVECALFEQFSASADARTLAGIAVVLDRSRNGFFPRAQVWELNGSLAFEAEGKACAAVSEDGRLLAMSSRHGPVELWDLANGASLYKLPKMKSDVARLCFLPGEGRLATWGGKEMVVWDLVPIRRKIPAIPPLKEADLEGAWKDLLGDSPKARKAVWRLSASAKLALPLLEKRLKPAPVVLTDRQLDDLLRRMDDDKLAVREAATQELLKLGVRAVPFVREALRRKDLPAETVRRLKIVSGKIDDPLAGLDGERLRSWRAIEVLERIGDHRSRRLLRRLCGGAPEAMETHEATGALRRLVEADERSRDSKR